MQKNDVDAQKKCPYCKSLLDKSSLSVPCNVCGTLYHAECARIEPVCSASGCAGNLICPPRQADHIWLKSIALAFLISITIHIAAPILRLIFAREIISFVPCSFHWVWEIGAAVVITRVVRLLRIHPKEFWVLIWLCFFVFYIFPPPNAVRFLSPRYVAIKGSEMVSGNLYHIEDPELRTVEKEILRQSLNEAQAIGDNTNVKVLLNTMRKLDKGREHKYGGIFIDTFLFWQTGVASGFAPPTGVTSEGFLGKIELFSTVGPTVIVEAGIKAFVWEFPVFLLFLIAWKVFKKEHFLITLTK